MAIKTTEPVGPHTFRIPYATEEAGAIGPITPEPQLGTAGYGQGQFVLGTNPAQDRVVRCYLAVVKTDDIPIVVDPEGVPDFITIAITRVDNGKPLGSQTFGAILRTEDTFPGGSGSRIWQTFARGFDGITTLGVKILKDEDGDVLYQATINPIYGVAEPLEVVLNLNNQDIKVVSPVVWS